MVGGRQATSESFGFVSSNDAVAVVTGQIAPGFSAGTVRTSCSVEDAKAHGGTDGIRIVWSLHLLRDDSDNHRHYRFSPSKNRSEYSKRRLSARTNPSGTSEAEQASARFAFGFFCTNVGVWTRRRIRFVSNGKKRLDPASLKICYLCGDPLTEPIDRDQVPPKQFFGKVFRRSGELDDLGSRMSFEEWLPEIAVLGQLIAP